MTLIQKKTHYKVTFMFELLKELKYVNEIGSSSLFLWSLNSSLQSFILHIFTYTNTFKKFNYIITYENTNKSLVRVILS